METTLQDTADYIESLKSEYSSESRIVFMVLGYTSESVFERTTEVEAFNILFEEVTNIKREDETLNDDGAEEVLELMEKFIEELTGDQNE